LFYVSRDGREDLVKLFLSNGCKPNHEDSYGQTPIFYTAREGHINIMKLLIEAGGDPDHIDEEG
jgi:ankyrin repeat protein